MARCLAEAGFRSERRLALSYFRLGALKEHVPLRLLVALDRLLQPTGQIAPFSPSVFTRNAAVGAHPPAALDGPLFKCLHCGASLRDEGEAVTCPHGHGRWALRDGLYDFKEPLSG